MKIGIIDGSFPQKAPFGFRNREINGLLAINQTTSALSPFTMFPGKDAFFRHAYGTTKEDFDNRKAGYLKYYPQNRNRIHYLRKEYREPFLAFSYFLADTYTYLPFFEANNLPFCFVLYPGGAFGVNNPSSDAMLSKIFSSAFFRKVIVTSDVTETYLRDTGLCGPDRIEMLWCGVPQFESGDFETQISFPASKQTLDVLFVAYKYSDRGYDKGYDVYIEAAKKVVKHNANVIFHVVGNFSATDYDVEDIKDNIIFHGLLSAKEIKKLYKKIDIQVGLSRSNALFDGNFDGFPLGFEAMRAGALLMTSDGLGQNSDRFRQNELCIVSLDPNEIALRIGSYFHDPEKMKTMAINGRSAINRLLDTNKRIERLNGILMGEALDG